MEDRKKQMNGNPSATRRSPHPVGSQPSSSGQRQSRSEKRTTSSTVTTTACRRSERSRCSSRCANCPGCTDRYQRPSRSRSRSGSRARSPSWSPKKRDSAPSPRRQPVVPGAATPSGTPMRKWKGTPIPNRREPVAVSDQEEAFEVSDLPGPSGTSTTSTRRWMADGQQMKKRQFSAVSRTAPGEGHRPTRRSLTMDLEPMEPSTSTATPVTREEAKNEVPLRGILKKARNADDVPFQPRRQATRASKRAAPSGEVSDEDEAQFLKKQRKQPKQTSAEAYEWAFGSDEGLDRTNPSTSRRQTGLLDECLLKKDYKKFMALKNTWRDHFEAEAKATDDGGRNVLHKLAEDRKNPQAKAMMIAVLVDNYGPDLLKAFDHDGKQPLHSAVAASHVAVLRLLVSHGASLTARGGSRKETAMEMAVRREQHDVMSELQKAAEIRQGQDGVELQGEPDAADGSGDEDGDENQEFLQDEDHQNDVDGVNGENQASTSNASSGYDGQVDAPEEPAESLVNLPSAQSASQKNRPKLLKGYKENQDTRSKCREQVSDVPVEKNHIEIDGFVQDRPDGLDVQGPSRRDRMEVNEENQGCDVSKRLAKLNAQSKVLTNHKNNQQRDTDSPMETMDLRENQMTPSSSKDNGEPGNPEDNQVNLDGDMAQEEDERQRPETASASEPVEREPENEENTDDEEDEEEHSDEEEGPEDEGDHIETEENVEDAEEDDEEHSDEEEEEDPEDQEEDAEAEEDSEEDEEEPERNQEELDKELDVAVWLGRYEEADELICRRNASFALGVKLALEKEPWMAGSIQLRFPKSFKTIRNAIRREIWKIEGFREIAPRLSEKDNSPIIFFAQRTLCQWEFTPKTEGEWALFIFEINQEMSWVTAEVFSIYDLLEWPSVEGRQMDRDRFYFKKFLKPGQAHRLRFKTLSRFANSLIAVQMIRLPK